MVHSVLRMSDEHMGDGSADKRMFEVRTFGFEFIPHYNENHGRANLQICKFTIKNSSILSIDWAICTFRPLRMSGEQDKIISYERWLCR